MLEKNRPPGGLNRGFTVCKFIGTKESVCLRIEFNSQRTGLGHQHGRRFIVLGHQYGRRDVMWKHSINVLYLIHDVEIPETKRFYCQGAWIGYNIEYACGVDRRKVGWSVYGHVIAEFSRMDRFSKLWGFELSPWSNKISAQNFKHYVTSMDRKMSPRYTQVMMVSVYSSLTAVN